MRHANRLIVCLIAAVIASAAFDVLAQFPGGGGRTRGGPPSGGMQRGERPAAPDNIMELIEYRLESFQDDLKLTPNQQKSWDPYADKVRALAADIVRERARAQAGTQLTAPQQINHALDVARNRLTALEDIASSAITLIRRIDARTETACRLALRHYRTADRGQHAVSHRFRRVPARTQSAAGPVNPAPYRFTSAPRIGRRLSAE